MNYCEIKNSQKGQTLKEMSGLSEFSAYSFISGFEEDNKRMPELDEIPHANSEPYLDKQLNTKQIGNTRYTTIKKFQELGLNQSVEEINPKLNREYSDLEIHLNQIGDSVIVETLHRPSEYDDVEEYERDIDFDGTTESNAVILGNALDRLQKYYGISMIPVTTQQLSEDPQFQNLPIFQAEAFIYNGNIYINTDKATVDAPIHEQLHLFLGSIRYNHPNLYFQLVSSTENIPNFQDKIKLYPNRTMSDIQEEIFVEELAKFLAGESSIFDNVDPGIMNFVMYNIKRDIDSIVFGKRSVKTLEDPFQYSLLQLGQQLDSNHFDVTTPGIINDAAIHRIMANTKEELLKNNELVENCS